MCCWFILDFTCVALLVKQRLKLYTQCTHSGFARFWFFFFCVVVLSRKFCFLDQDSHTSNEAHKAFDYCLGFVLCLGLYKDALSMWWFASLLPIRLSCCSLCFVYKMVMCITLMLHGVAWCARLCVYMCGYVCEQSTHSVLLIISIWLKHRALYLVSFFYCVYICCVVNTISLLWMHTCL